MFPNKNNVKTYPYDEVQKIIDEQLAPDSNNEYVLTLGQIHYLIEAVYSEVLKKG